MPELDAAGLLVHADRAALVRYCELAAQEAEMTARIAADGFVVEVPVYGRYGGVSGTQQRTHPLLRERAALAGLVDRLAAGLGLTPAGRSRLAVPGADKPKANKVLELRARIEAARANPGPAAG